MKFITEEKKMCFQMAMAQILIYVSPISTYPIPFKEALSF